MTTSSTLCSTATPAHCARPLWKCQMSVGKTLEAWRMSSVSCKRLCSTLWSTLTSSESSAWRCVTLVNKCRNGTVLCMCRAFFACAAASFVMLRTALTVMTVTTGEQHCCCCHSLCRTGTVLTLVYCNAMQHQ
jgi:hypothetical protein